MASQYWTGIQIAEAERLLTNVITVIEARGDVDPRLPVTLENLVRVQLFGGNHHKAVEAAERCLQLTQQHNAQPLPLARTCNNLAVVYSRLQVPGRSACLSVD